MKYLLIIFTMSQLYASVSFSQANEDQAYLIQKEGPELSVRESINQRITLPTKVSVNGAQLDYDVLDNSPYVTSDDEGFCLIEKEGGPLISILKNWKAGRPLIQRSNLWTDEKMLMLPGINTDFRITPKSLYRPHHGIVKDKFARFNTHMGVIKVGCSIDTHSSETVPYEFNEKAKLFLKARLGLEFVEAADDSTSAGQAIQ